MLGSLLLKYTPLVVDFSSGFSSKLLMSASLSVSCIFFFPKGYLCSIHTWMDDGLMACLVNPSLVGMDLNSISGYLYRMRITLVWVWASSPVAELQSESHPCCDVGTPHSGCGFKKYHAVLQFGESNAELQPGVFVYVLDTCSWHMEKECSCDCKIKHAKVRKCQDVDFPTLLHVCLVTQSLIT